MRNVITVIKHEIVTTVGRPSFWLTTLVLPLCILAFTFGSQLFSARMIEDEDPLTADNPQAPIAIGYVDLAGLVQNLPPGIPADLVRAYPDVASAQTAIENGELRQYYVIAADYIATGAVAVVDSEYSPLGNFATADMIESILNFNLVGGTDEARLIDTPIMDLQIISSEPEKAGSESYNTRFIVGYGMLFILFFVLTMSSSFMLRSVSNEKENRTVEVLLMSVRPRELMLGKVIGLGVAALLQMTVWLGGSLITMTRGNPLLNSLGIVLETIVLPPGFVMWVLAYFLLGYLLYASLLGAIGALAPTARESGQFTFLALLPLMLPMWLNTAFVEDPNGPLATGLSLFPLTAPTSMMPRLAMGGVPLWQPIVSLIGLAVTTYVFVLLAGRLFRADTLLSVASLNWARLAAEVKKRS
ncbi:MAG: ABC transporter permease [Anaerolineae bacterium]|nr:ABC transporter permease [Anaerolineae bacterium]